MDVFSNLSTFAPTSGLDMLTNLLHGGGSMDEILGLFRHLTDDERQYLYSRVNIHSEAELIELLSVSEQKQSPVERIEDFSEEQLRRNLLLYVPPVLIIMGTVGNVLSFIVLRCRAMVKVSSYRYLASLAVADTLVLYIGLLRLWLMEVTGTDFHDISDWVCKVAISFGYTASDLSVWLIIAVTVERYIVVCFPLKTSTMINTGRAKKVIGFLVLLMFVINLHFLWTVEIVVDVDVDGKNVTDCQAAPEHQHLVNEVWPWVDAFIYSFIPFLFIIILNILIILKVVKARNHRQRMQNTPEKHFHQHMSRRRNLGQGWSGQALGSSNGTGSCRRASGPDESTKLTIMLLTVSFAFLLTTLPMNSSLIFTAFWNQQKNHATHAKAKFRLAKTITELLMYVNHSINFCLYCATGQKFRQQIAHLLRCRDNGGHTAWLSSTQTGQTTLARSVRFSKMRPNERLLLTQTTDDSDSNGDAVSLRTKV